MLYTKVCYFSKYNIPFRTSIMNSMSGGAFTVLFLSTHLLLTLGQQYFPLTDYYPSYPGAYGVMGMMRPPPVTQPPPYPAWNYQRVGMGPYQHMYATPNLYARGTSQYTVCKFYWLIFYFKVLIPVEKFKLIFTVHTFNEFYVM